MKTKESHFDIITKFSSQSPHSLLNPTAIPFHPIWSPQTQAHVAMIPESSSSVSAMPKNSYAAALVSSSHTKNSAPMAASSPIQISPSLMNLISAQPRIHDVKSSEYPIFFLPQLGSFHHRYPSNLYDDDDQQSPKFLFNEYVFSDGDDVPRPTLQRQLLRAELRSFKKHLQSILGRGQKVVCYIPSKRKKWKKYPPISVNKISAEALFATTNAEFPSCIQPFSFGSPSLYEDDIFESHQVYPPSSDKESSESESDFLDYQPLQMIKPNQRRKYQKRYRNLPPPVTTRRTFKMRKNR